MVSAGSSCAVLANSFGAQIASEPSRPNDNDLAGQVVPALVFLAYEDSMPFSSDSRA